MDNTLVTGIKSKERVQQHGEVFTPDSIVNDMLDIVDKELDKNDIWKYIDYTYIEPSCGNGNFLIRILDRKFEFVQRLPKEQWNLGLVHSLCSVYGVDIQKDNIDESKQRILQLIKTGDIPLLDLPNREKKPFSFNKFTITPELEKTINFILDLNIQQGDCLTGERWDGIRTTNANLEITEYTWNGEQVSRREISLNNIKSGIDAADNSYDSVNFKELGNTVLVKEYDAEAEDDEAWDML